jgi:phosphomannomutase
LPLRQHLRQGGGKQWSELTCFKAYDIRAKSVVNIDEGIAYRIGRAVAQHFGAKSVVIGFDARETSPAFCRGGGAGHARSGADVLTLAWLGRGNVLGGDRI